MIVTELPVLPIIVELPAAVEPVLIFTAPTDVEVAFRLIAPVVALRPPFNVVAPVTPSVPPTVAPPVTVADASVEAPACNVPLTVVAPAVNAAVFVA